MAINPNIALSVRPVEFADPLAQYGKVAAIQQAQIQNRLAQQQMEQEEGVYNYLRSANLGTPEGRAGLRQFGKTGLAYEKLISEQEQNALKRQELEGKVREQRMAALGTGLTSVLADPSDANLSAAFDRLDATGVDTKPFRTQFANMPDLAARKTAITQYVTSNPEGRQALAFVQPKPEKFDLNGKVVVVDMNPNSPTYQQQVKEFAKGLSPDTSARLAFDQQKFAWEKANPGYELKESEDGTLYGVNKRTLQAVPVNVGAPSATPAASAPVAGTPPAGAPAATPGAVVASTGTPLKGKSQALTEAQGNATAYGMRMTDANTILANLEKSGVTSGGRVKGFVQGALTSTVPFMGEKLAEGVGSVMNVLPGAMGGPNEAQQSYEQAKQNFITAVLRKESGAAISPDEFAREEKKYFPQAGEGEKIIRQKQRARELAIEAMKIQAGPGAKNIGAGAVNDPLGIRR